LTVVSIAGLFAAWFWLWWRGQKSRFNHDPRRDLGNSGGIQTLFGQEKK